MTRQDRLTTNVQVVFCNLQGNQSSLGDIMEDIDVAGRFTLIAHLYCGFRLNDQGPSNL